MLLFGGVTVWRFQPALPMRGVTQYSSMFSRRSPFQPALPMRGVT